MPDILRGNPKATTRKDLWKIFELAKVTKNDVFCDLGCGYGNLCRWAIQKVDSVLGTEEHKRRFRIASRNVHGLKKIRILNENYRYAQTLRKLRKGTIFYCTNGLSLGFYRKFEKTVKPKTRLVIYDLPPYPLKPNSFDDSYYLMITPFAIAKTKNEWIKSIAKRDLARSLIKDLEKSSDNEDSLDFKEDIFGMDWITKKRK